MEAFLVQFFKSGEDREHTMVLDELWNYLVQGYEAYHINFPSKMNSHRQHTEDNSDRLEGLIELALEPLFMQFRDWGRKSSTFAIWMTYLDTVTVAHPCIKDKLLGNTICQHRVLCFQSYNKPTNYV